MAHVVYNSGLQKSLPPEAAYKLWKALHKISTLPPADQEKVRAVKAVYLNWRTAPDDYIKENLPWIVPMALIDWAVDRVTGKPKRPSNDRAWKFAKRWGLWENGKPSDLVTRPPAVRTQTALSSDFMIDH